MDCMLWQTTDPVDIFSFCDKKNKYKTLISDLIRKKLKTFIVSTDYIIGH